VTGYTESDQTTFPVKVGPHLTFSGARDAFVAKVKTDGTAFVYAGYIGGTGTDQGTGIAVDATGNAYVSGFTSSDEASFPVKVGPALFYQGGAEDAFVAKVKSDGTALVYVGYIGGAASDAATGIAVDAGGNAYVVGGTASDASSFPVLAGPGLVYGGGLADAFVAKVKADGTRLLWAGYIGGDGFDQGNAIAVDAGGSVYVAGSTSSTETSFPVTVGPDLTYGGGQFDAFVAKISGKPDLIESKISAAAAAAPGGTLVVADAAANHGLGTAPASTTRYYLSTDTVKGTGDILLGSRAVPALDPGFVDAFVVLTTLTVPTTVQPGAYYLIGCADDLKVVAELDESNNCRSSIGTVQVALPDLLTTAVSAPPAYAKPGDKLSVTDTVRNASLAVSAAPSTTRYYLSTNTTKGAGDILLTGSRAVSSIAPGATSTGTVSVTIPASITIGQPYHLIACADDLTAVKEGSETNNCLASTTTVFVTLPNLSTTGVNNPPATVQRGHSFLAGDTTINDNAVDAGPTTTRYYLSADVVRGAGDILLTGGRQIGPLAGGAASTGTALLTVPAATPAGTYYLIGCANDLNTVKETGTVDNCETAINTMMVTP